MPERDPRVGEIWNIPNTDTRGVVQEVVDGRTTVLSPMGRSASMATTSFLLTWHFQKPPPGEPCSHKGCSSGGHLQMFTGGQWQWVCVEHTLPGSDLRFEEGGESPIALEKCPSCGVPANREGSGSSGIAGRFRLHWCGSCSRRWVLLVGRGTPQDRAWVPGALYSLWRGFVEQQLQGTRCFMGHQMASLMKNILTHSKFEFPVTHTNHFGGNQVLLIARGRGVPEESLDGAPAKGSVWWQTMNKESFRVASHYQLEGKPFLILDPTDESRRQGFASQEIALEQFQGLFDNVPPVIDNDPIQVGDLWVVHGNDHRVTKVDRSITVLDGEGEHTIDERTFRRTCTRVRIRPALVRLLEDDLF